jgi:oxygen-dependent protoporphyrinogen oxidase
MSAPKSAKSAAVVGAGLGGLSAAYRLRQAGWDVTVFEASDRPGGRVQTIERDGYRLDTGASAIADSYTAYLDLIRELGLSAEISPPVASVGIYRNGRLHELPLGNLLKMGLTPLLSWAAKLRMARLGFDIACARLRGQLDYADMSKAAPLDTESAAAYAQRALGSELKDYFASPITRVMLIADPEKISKVELFSGVANIMTTQISCLRGGQGRLPRLLADKLSVRYRHTVQHVGRADHGVALRHQDANGAEHDERFDACVIACPLQEAVRICTDDHARLMPLHECIGYTQCITVALAFKHRPATRAFLAAMPGAEDREVALIFLDHNKSDDRAPAGHALLDCHWEADAAARLMNQQDEAIVQRTLQTVYRVFPELKGQLQFSHVTRWAQALPCTGVGSYQQIGLFNAALDTKSAIQYASDFMSAAGQNAVIELGNRAAATLIRR